MPKYRSITVSVMSQWEMKQFPEFPHPDNTQNRSQGSIQSVDGSETRRPASASTSSTSTSKADSRLDRDPMISCYIPSIPGIRFFLQYTIEPPYPEGQLFYFKLFMNGRHINSWGVNPRTNPRGQVLRGLFEPDGACISENSRTILGQSGIDSRPFLFTPEIDGRSPADDGGLIEVRIFRAKGRKRRAPSLETFRPQEKYGINLPSAGLLDNPQDTRYYDYILVDPKDEPYAAFLFHYRSWEFLQSLQLIPSSHPRALLKQSNSFAFLAGPSTDKGLQEDDEAEQLESKDGDDSWVALEDSPPRVTYISQLCNSNMLEVAHDRPRHIGGHDEAFKSSSLSLDQRKCRAGIPISAFSVPQTTLYELAYERPLPKLPKAKSSFDHSRNSSTSSNAPSITPSLLPWLDRDSDNPSPEPIIGVAVTVPVLRSSPVPDDSAIDRSSYSSADWSIETPPQPMQPLRPMSNPFVIPPEALFLPTSVTVRKSRRKTSRFISARGRLVIEDSDNEDGNPENEDEGASPPPSEAEWLRRQQGLSPIKGDSKQIELATLRSFASVETVDMTDSFGHVRRKHMASAMYKNQNQQADGSENKDRHADLLMLGSVPLRPNDKAYYGKPEWI